jgi:hypothetical protein
MRQAEADLPQCCLLIEARPPYTLTHRGTLDITLNGYRQPILDLLDDLGTEPSTFDAIGLREFLAPTRELFQSMEIEEPGYGCADVLTLFDCPGLLRARAGTRHSDCCEMAAVLAAQVSLYPRCGVLDQLL